jgi:hypothetical protein
MGETVEPLTEAVRAELLLKSRNNFCDKVGKLLRNVSTEICGVP